jgi:hypothetical protein
MKQPGTENLQLLFCWDIKTLIPSGKIKFWMKAESTQIGEISGSYGGEYEDNCLLGCCAV